MNFLKPKLKQSKSNHFRCIVEQDIFALIPRHHIAEVIDENEREDWVGELLLFRCTTSHVCETSFVPIAPFRLDWFNRKVTFDDTLREQDIIEVKYYIDIDVFFLKAASRMIDIFLPFDKLIELKNVFLYMSTGGRILSIPEIAKKTSLIEQVAAYNIRPETVRDDFVVGEWEWVLETIPHYKLPEDIAKDWRVVRALKEKEDFR